MTQKHTRLLRKVCPYVLYAILILYINDQETDKKEMNFLELF